MHTCTNHKYARLTGSIISPVHTTQLKAFNLESTGGFKSELKSMQPEVSRAGSMGRGEGGGGGGGEGGGGACDDSVTIPRCPNLVVDLKVRVALKKNSRAYTRIMGTPYFKSGIHLW